METTYRMHRCIPGHGTLTGGADLPGKVRLKRADQRFMELAAGAMADAKDLAINPHGCEQA